MHAPRCRRPDPVPARQEGHLHDTACLKVAFGHRRRPPSTGCGRDLAGIGRHPGTGGYRRFAWTREDADLREWFAGEAAARGLDLVDDRAGNLWAWWGDPDASPTARPGVVLGSHLDSVPDGGAFDGPLGVVSASPRSTCCAPAAFVPARPLGVALFGDEEGARFGVACAGSRLLTGALPRTARAA